jgi:hypothetical protein
MRSLFIAFMLHSVGKYQEAIGWINGRAEEIERGSFGVNGDHMPKRQFKPTRSIFSFSVLPSNMALPKTSEAACIATLILEL